MNKQIFFLLIVIYIGLTINANAQDWAQIGTDTDMRGDGVFDVFGWSVSLNSDGSVIAICASGEEGGNSYVKVFQNIDGTWTQKGSTIGAGSTCYSVSLSADGSIVAIGGYNASYSGRVEIFEYTPEPGPPGNWEQIGADIDGEAADDYSGLSVSLSSDGSIVAIGAYGNDGNGSYSGHVRIYENISGTWSQLGSDIDGEAAEDYSGASVSLSSDGSIVAIGARGNDANGSSSGHVRIYENISGTWTQMGTDIDGEAEGDQSGYSVSLSSDGSIVAIGAIDNNDTGSGAGHVRIYENNSGTWTQIGEDINGEAAGDQSGYSVSLSSDGSIVAIGAPYNNGNIFDVGHVRIYQNILGIWTQIGTDIDGNTITEVSGYSVSLSSDGSTVGIGAPYYYGTTTNAGCTRVLYLQMPPTVTSHPINQTNICSGNPVDFNVAGENIDNYQWQESTDGGSNWSNLINNATCSGVTTNTLSILTNLTLNDFQYRCNLINEGGTTSSNPATLSIMLMSPATLTVGISVNQDLSWDATTGALNYDVYFGEMGSMAFIGNQTDINYETGTLNFSTEYEWQIIPVTTSGPEAGCGVWTFTTEVNPGPPDSGGVAVNDNGTNPNVYAILDANVSTHNKGILIPRLTTTQRTGLNLMGASEEGLTVYDLNTDSFWLWNGTEWREFAMVTKSLKNSDSEDIIEEHNKLIKDIINRLNKLEKKD